MLGSVLGPEEELEEIKENHKVIEEVVRKSMEVATTEEKRKVGPGDVLNESSDCESALVMDLSDVDNEKM